MNNYVRTWNPLSHVKKMWYTELGLVVRRLDSAVHRHRIVIFSTIVKMPEML
jgi:hypothetical protein